MVDKYSNYNLYVFRTDIFNLFSWLQFVQLCRLTCWCDIGASTTWIITCFIFNACQVLLIPRQALSTAKCLKTVQVIIGDAWPNSRVELFEVWFLDALWRTNKITLFSISDFNIIWYCNSLNKLDSLYTKVCMASIQFLQYLLGCILLYILSII